MRCLPTAFAAVVFLVTGLILANPARADGASPADIRAVIDGQIAAFQADDGNAAYAFAAPSIRQIFTSADMFMAMVKSGYQPVYRPKSVAFGRMREADGRVLQEVFLVGPDGESYTALYSMQQQGDGSWKISGCRIVQSVAESA